MSELAQALSEVAPSYEVPDDDLVGEVLVPGMRASTDVRIAADSSRLAAPGASCPGVGRHYIARGDHTVLRLLISPEISEEDRQAIEGALRDPEEVINAAMERLFRGRSPFPFTRRATAIPMLGVSLGNRSAGSPLLPHAAGAMPIEDVVDD